MSQSSGAIKATGLQHELGKREPFLIAEQEAYLNLLRTSAEAEGDFAVLFRTQRLSQSTYNLLRILRGAGEAGRRCNEIAGDMVVRVPDITRLVDRMENAGFVARERCDADRRAVIVKLTPKGHEVLEELDQAVVDLHRSQMGHMSAADLAELNRLLVLARAASSE